MRISDLRYQRQTDHGQYISYVTFYRRYLKYGPVVMKIGHLGRGGNRKRLQNAIKNMVKG